MTSKKPRQTGYLLYLFITFLSVVFLIITACSGGNDGNNNEPGTPQSQLTVTPRLDFGRQFNSLSLAIRNEGTQTENWQIQTGYPTWLSFSVSNGSLAVAESLNVVATVDRNALAIGIHTAQLTVSGNTQNINVDVSVEVINQIPQVFITSPTLTTFTANDTITFSATATDAEDGNLSANALAWNSSIDGQLGSGNGISVNLSVGIHSISVTATDSAGAVGRDSIVLTVNNPPYWEHSQGPYGGIVHDRISDSLGNIYIATGVGGENVNNGRNGIFRSIDGGVTWSEFHEGLTNLAVNSLGADSQGRVFAGTWYGGIFRLEKDSTTWVKINNGLEASSPIVDTMVINNNDEIFIGTRESAVYRSVDHGDTWNKLSTGLPTTYNAWKLFILGNGGLYLQTLEWNQNYDSLYRSTNNGDSWQKVFTATSNFINASHVTANGNILLALYNSIQISTTGGDSWANLTNLAAGEYIRFITSNAAGDVLVSNSDNVVRRQLNGETLWSDISANLPRNQITMLKTGIDDALYISTISGLFKSNNIGNSWMALNQGLSNTVVRALAINSNNAIFAAATNGMYRSDNSGDAWTDINNGLPQNQPINTLVFNSSGDLLAGLGVFDDSGVGQLYITNDGGANWQSINSGFSTTSGIAALALNSQGHIFVGTGFSTLSGNNGVFRSTDNGVNWNPINNGFASTQKTRIINSIAIDANDVLFAGSAAGLYRSVDNGDTWNLLSNGISSAEVKAIAIHGNTIYALLNNNAFNEIYSSTNNGDSWQSMPITGLYNPGNALHITSDGQILIGSFQFTHRWSATANKWELLEALDPYFYQRKIYSFSSDSSGRVYAGTSNGVYRSIK